jgi:signal transduction histidine kinase/DNA-binding NarL/FixJ family response regulator
MNKELLNSYIDNTVTATKSVFIIFVVFISIRLYVYGKPSDVSLLLLGEAFLMISFMTFAVFSRYLYVIRRRGLIDQHNIQFYTLFFAGCKLLIYFPLFLIMFWPLQTVGEFHHFYGFLFIFCLISICPLSSGSFLPLFKFELLMLSLFSVFVSISNYHVQEDIYAGVIICLYSVQAYLTGKKMNNNTVLLIKNRASLAKANKAKADFLAVLSHEIKTPMTGIMGMVDFLNETKTTKEQDDCLNTISYCAGTLLNTLNDVLDASKIDAGKFSIDKVNFDLHSLLSSSIRIANQASQERDLVLDLNIEKNVPRYVHLDPNRLQQVILNYLNNAIKFTEKGKISLSAGLVAGKNGLKMIRVECKDTGIGISKENQKKIFKKFSQADSSISRKYGGTGLGLSIAKRLIEIMGGSVGFKSEEGKGSVFYFEVPFEEPTDNQLTEIHDEQSAQSIVPKAILLAEDNRINRLIAVRILEKDGHSVECVENGQQALDKVQEGNFDLVFMDLQMPIMDGVESTKKIKSLGNDFDKLPIIGLTANTNKEHLKHAKTAGMIDFVFKPYEPGSLRAALIKHTNQDLAVLEEEIKNDRLELLIEEFGEEYALSFVNEALAEVSDLLSKIKELKEHQTQELEYLSHDLKGMCGSIGLEQSYILIEKIEKACAAGEIEFAFSQISLLTSVLKTEMNSIKGYID